jgi:ElaB/YqjD/DUF883 family membrane-anchored ribosome-binding protein
MGEEPGTARASVATDAGAAGAKDPEQIREEIEATRQEMGDTVEALAAKADVKARVREKIDATKESATHKKDELLGKAREASPDSVSAGATQATQKAKENPLPVAAVGAFVGGFVLGRLTKRT